MPHMHYLRAHWKLILPICLVLLTTLFAIDRSLHRASTQPDIDGWQTYTSPYLSPYRFTLKYPPGWYLAPRMARGGADYLADSRDTLQQYQRYGEQALRDDQVVVSVVSIGSGGADIQSIANAVSGDSSAGYSVFSVSGAKGVRIKIGKSLRYGLPLAQGYIEIIATPASSRWVSQVDTMIITYQHM